MSKLQLVCWPWAGPVALEERGPDMVQYHIIHNWLWLGAVDSLAQAAELTALPAGFDHDGYKIAVSLCSAVSISCTRLANDIVNVKTAGPAQSLTGNDWARPAVFILRAELLSRYRHFTFRRFTFCQMLLKIRIELFFCSGVRML